MTIILLFAILSPVIQSNKTHSELEISDEVKIYLASTYAPVLWFYQNSLWEEPFTPIEAEYFISVSTEDESGDLKLEKDGYTGAQYLQDQYNGVETPVYIRVTTDEYNGNTYLVIQYWLCYLYNYGGALSLFNFNHEGEWEMIEVVLEYDKSIVEKRSCPEPYIIAYSRHSGGESRQWDHESVEKVEKDGYHPVAYIAYGTHAPYFQDMGWNEDLNKGIYAGQEDMNFILIEDREWLHFSGKWGGQENSPVGPLFQEEKWSTPVEWAVKYLDNLLLHLEHPSHLLITNERGERIGFVGEEFVNEINDAYAVVTDEHEYYYLPQDTYSVEMSALEGDIGFDAFVNDNNRTNHIYYRNEVKTRITKAYTEIGTGINEYRLKLDKDGDGRIDLTLEPVQITEYKEFLLYLLIVVVLVLVVFAASRNKKKPEKPMKKLRMAQRALEVVSFLFFLLWFGAALDMGDIGDEYEMRFLQSAVGIFLFSQVLPALRQYSTTRKIEVFFTRVGWALAVIYIGFSILPWTGLVGEVDSGINVFYFAVTALAFLLVGYLLKFGRFMKKRSLKVLFVIGGFALFFWILFREFSIFPEYTNYILIIGALTISLGIILLVKKLFY